MEHPQGADQLSSNLARFCGLSATMAMKGMAADGMAPLPPTELVTSLYYLAYDGDAAIAKRAADTLTRLQGGLLEGTLQAIASDFILDGVVRLLLSQTSVVKSVLLNRAVADETVIWLAGQLRDEALLDVIALNEQRLLRCPAIIESLYHNPKARMSTVDRVIELAVRSGIELTQLPCYKELKALLGAGGSAELAAAATATDVLLRGFLGPAEVPEIDLDIVEKILTIDAPGEEPQPVELVKKVVSLQQLFDGLTTSGKIRLATLGSSFQRAVLVRDSNKLVIMAAIQSPAVGDSEAVSYSKYRSLPDEAYRYMARKREWVKHYAVKLNLAQNPRCPLEIALHMLPHLRPNDLRQLERDKNIPQAVANAAKQLRRVRMK